MTSNELKQMAIKRVENNQALSPYKYILIDDPWMDGPTRYEHPQQQLDNYYRKVINSPAGALLKFAAAGTLEFKDFLDGKIAMKIKEIEYLKSRDVKNKKHLERIEMLFSEGKKALEQNDLAGAAGYVHSAIRTFEFHTYQYHWDRKEPFVRKFKKIQAGGEKGQINRFGTDEEKKRIRDEWQIFTDDLLLKSPSMYFGEAIKITAEHFTNKNFKVSPRTIRRYIKNIAY